mgnify:CR=1 FL=1
MNKAGRHGGLASLCIRRPIGVLAAASVIVVVGLFYAGQLPLDLLPQIVYPQIRAAVTYPGVAPEVMEEQVTKILETSLATTEDVIELESETTEGESDISLHFSYGTDINFALHRGEVMAVAGLSGSGKTELGKALFGDLRASQGTITVKGKSVPLKVYIVEEVLPL